MPVKNTSSARKYLFEFYFDVECWILDIHIIFMNQLVSTEFIVLRKTAYQESSLIISGLSPSAGKIDFILKGARRISKNAFPEIDYFRVFLVSFYDRNKTLIIPTTFELLKTHDALARVPEKFTEAFGIVPFIMRNKHYGVPCPVLYKSLLRYIDSLIKNKRYQQFFVKLAYLYENGLLPEELAYSKEDQKRNKNFILLLINHILDGSEFPILTENYYLKLERWINSLCVAVELH